MSICHISLIIRLNSYYTISTMSRNNFWGRFHFFFKRCVSFDFLKRYFRWEWCMNLAIKPKCNKTCGKHKNNWHNYALLSFKIICTFFSNVSYLENIKIPLKRSQPILSYFSTMVLLLLVGWINFSSLFVGHANLTEARFSDDAHWCIFDNFLSW